MVDFVWIFFRESFIIVIGKVIVGICYNFMISYISISVRVIKNKVISWVN